MRKTPAYAITSVDNALTIALLLQQEGALRITDVAERLGTSVSTAHRLLAMLVYRDFAVQGADRSYRPGPALRATEKSSGPVRQLRELGSPVLRDLAARTGETSNLQVRVGREVRFIASAECDQALRVGDRTGVVLPAHLASGGRALLAALEPGAVRDLYRGELDDKEIDRLVRDTTLIRKRGFAINDQRTEDELVGLSVIVRIHSDAIAAIAIAMPASRFKREHLAGWCHELTTASSRLQRALEGAASGLSG